MGQVAYRADRRRRAKRSYKWLYGGLAALAVLAIGLGVYQYFFAPTPVERAVDKLRFSAELSGGEKQAIRQAVRAQSKTYRGTVEVDIRTTAEVTKPALVLSAYVPVTNVYATRQAVDFAELDRLNLYVPAGTEAAVIEGIAKISGVPSAKIATLPSLDKLADTAVAFIPAGDLSSNSKLLTFEGSYYLDSFTKGAIFREAVFRGFGASGLDGLTLNGQGTKDDTLKVNMTGVTALTRVMINKLRTVKDATYFSQKIGSFLADADITHVSNEVSFKPGCTYHASSFCSPPDMIEALKDSGVDLVELTGNHNNDQGNSYNTDTIKLYHSLGWKTIGGGLNEAEAAKPYIADLKGSQVAFLGYNYADSPQSGAIARATTAGANHFTYDKVKADVAAAKKTADFVIVDIQFWECYAYPNGYLEFPQCDGPIPTQADVFRRVVDLGADMVVGSSAHQPQTYELYKGKPIYYGLGNLYFEQTSWPGTERGIILTHYFAKGKLIQTKITPTVYHKELQVRVMTSKETTMLLERLNAARP
jgi:hypothetical protein